MHVVAWQGCGGMSSAVVMCVVAWQGCDGVCSGVVGVWWCMCGGLELSISASESTFVYFCHLMGSGRPIRRSGYLPICSAEFYQSQHPAIRCSPSCHPLLTVLIFVAPQKMCLNMDHGGRNSHLKFSPVFTLIFRWKKVSLAVTCQVTKFSKNLCENLARDTTTEHYYIKYVAILQLQLNILSPHPT